MWWFLIFVNLPCRLVIVGGSKAELDEPLDTFPQAADLVLLQTSAKVSSPKKKSIIVAEGSRRSSFIAGALQKQDGAKRHSALKDHPDPGKTSGKHGEATSLETPAAAPISPARTALLTEQGYLSIVAQKSNDQMKSFIRRVLAANGLGINKSAEGALSGFVPFYSGQKATQSLQSMHRELEKAPWVVRIPGFIAEALVDGASGMSAPLSEAGYQLVAAMRSDAEMSTFMRRVLNETRRPHMHSEPKIERVIDDLASLYSGTAGPERSLARLRRDLQFELPSAMGAAAPFSQ